MAEPIQFVVSGQDVRAPLRVPGGDAVGVAVGDLVHSVRLDGTMRSSQSVELQVEALPGRDVVVLHLGGGPPLVLHPESAADLLREQESPLERSPDTNAVRVPQELRWPTADMSSDTRSRSGGVLLKALEIFRGPLAPDGFEVVSELAAGKIAKAVVKGFDDEVSQGLYELGPGDLKPLKGAPKAVFSRPANGKPMLVLVHGTFSSTHGTFQKMWRSQRDIVLKLFEHYGSVYAFDHRTLGESPLENAVQLVNDLPEGARVHFITHSRGGLVAEAIARAPLADGEGASIRDEGQRKTLAALRTALAERKIEVERIVRVACPTRGTLLAGRRLDAFLSILRWGIQLAGLPLADVVFQLLGQVAQTRADVNAVPGLEAMTPGSEFVRWLHKGEGQALGELRVVAGDLQGDSLLSWLKALPADALFWTDNDLIVQTRSMYGGALRASDALFFFARGAQVSHFSYFHEPATANAVLQATISDEPKGFRKIGVKSWKGEDSFGLRASEVALPVLFFLPGVDGSGSPAYQPLLAELSRTHQVACFDWAWEAPLQEAADRLHQQIAETLPQAEARAIRIITHGAGGLVLRSLIARKPDWWKSFMARTGARVIFAGCPHRGYWRPMQLLSGDDELRPASLSTNPLFDRAEACAQLSKAVGLLQLQANLRDPQVPLQRSSIWQNLADLDYVQRAKMLPWHSAPEQRVALKWCVPDEETLTKAAAFWEELESPNARDALNSTAGRLVQVLGRASQTPAGYRATDSFAFLSVIDGGDGRVTDASAWLPDVHTWRAACGHEELTFHAATVRAYAELLETGKTRALTAVEGAPRVSSVHGDIAQSRGSTLSATSYAPMPLAGVFDAPAWRQSLEIEVVNGDLRYVREPLLLGHYRSATLTGSELAVDGMIGGTMTQALLVGAYPSQIASNKIFLNRHVLADQPHQVPKPKAAIIVGLGDEGKLSSANLAATVCQGVLAWSHRLIEMESGARPERGYVLAATLLGSGGSGIHVGQAGQLIAQGVNDANALLSEMDEPWPLVARLQLIEVYLDRATEAWNALKIQAEAAPLAYKLAPTIRTGSGHLKRPTHQGYRGGRFDFISARSTATHEDYRAISYSISVRRARTEVREHRVKQSSLEQVLKTAPNGPSAGQVGSILFRMLIPREMQTFLTESGELLLEVDPGTAGIPWELLDDQSALPGEEGAKPWAIRSKLIRKLRTTEFSELVEDAAASHGVLVIGEPNSKYPRLPGARREANAVAESFRNSGRIRSSDVVDLIANDDPLSGATFLDITERLLNGRWRVVHIAGHGEPKKGSSLGGIVSSDNALIGPEELAGQAVAPQLVFLNCCYLANREDTQLLVSTETGYDRVQFAVDVAEQLIQNGVRCVIAAGWAVNDIAAETFARSFYDALISQGCSFANAVAHARTQAREHGGNTWAAYQCYGDPDWQFEPRRGVDISEISSADALLLVLDEIVARTTPANREENRERLAKLAASLPLEWAASGRVQESFGQAWNAVGDRIRTIDALERAVSAKVDAASFSAVEQLGNLLVRQAASIQGTNDDREAMLQRGIEKLRAVVALDSSVERLALCGSAYKRKAMMLAERQDAESETQSLRESLDYYTKAQKLAVAGNDPTMFYPALNQLAIELAVAQRESRKPAFDADLCAAIVCCLEGKATDDPDFWTYCGLIEVELYQALASEQLGPQMNSLIARLRDLYRRDSAPGKWSSLRDQLDFIFRRASAADKAAVAGMRKMIEDWSKS